MLLRVFNDAAELSTNNETRSNSLCPQSWWGQKVATLLNDDYKIIAHVYASGLKTTLPEVIFMTQLWRMENTVDQYIAIFAFYFIYLTVNSSIIDNSFVLFLDIKQAFNIL